MSHNLGRCVSVQTFRPPAPHFNRTVERYPEDGILGRLQNGREHLLAPEAGQHITLCAFRTGKAFKSVGLGSRRREEGPASVSATKNLNVQCGPSLSLGLDRAADPAHWCIELNTSQSGGATRQSTSGLSMKSLSNLPTESPSPHH